MATRVIAINEKTATHQATLEAKGYECKVVGEELHVEVTEAVLGTVDMSTPELQKEVLTDMVQNHKGFGYETRFITPEVKAGEKKACFGGAATAFLGPQASALIMKKLAGTKSTSGVDAIFAEL
jgi:hypothetical protein